MIFLGPRNNSSNQKPPITTHQRLLSSSIIENGIIGLSIVLAFSLVTVLSIHCYLQYCKKTLNEEKESNKQEEQKKQNDKEEQKKQKDMKEEPIIGVVKENIDERLSKLRYNGNSIYKSWKLTQKMGINKKMHSDVKLPKKKRKKYINR